MWLSQREHIASRIKSIYDLILWFSSLTWDHFIRIIQVLRILTFGNNKDRPTPTVEARYEPTRWCSTNRHFEPAPGVYVGVAALHLPLLYVPSAWRIIYSISVLFWWRIWKWVHACCWEVRTHRSPTASARGCHIYQCLKLLPRLRLHPAWCRWEIYPQISHCLHRCRGCVTVEAHTRLRRNSNRCQTCCWRRLLLGLSGLVQEWEVVVSFVRQNSCRNPHTWSKSILLKVSLTIAFSPAVSASCIFCLRCDCFSHFPWYFAAFANCRLWAGKENKIWNLPLRKVIVVVFFSALRPSRAVGLVEVSCVHVAQ